ncbi:hypothetical protein J1N51_00360 [Psychrosphaera ytuae]|uniref:KfrA N-terminal DNA-binding domain-containing protein n=1 Tax=Psychrosphaera ytuae TaxID=2820710 RepID=A0A975HIA2_9GAMM|nr:hypothetical protein [Psychrosphaera ytuae]QTH63987.1 hypothetical protein J1N51_00360 [Psychrosphaera ytuae]
MNNQEIITICQQLESEGKSPTVALVKARMAGPKVLPVIIAGIKQYQANPTLKVTDTADEENDNLRAEPTAEGELAQRVEILEAQVEKLTQLVESLTRDKN